jgi:hypothetical protein
MRVRVRAAHGRAFILKNLNPRVSPAQIGGLFLPGFHHLFQRAQAQFRQGFAVIRREADNAAGAARALAAHQRIAAFRRIRRVGHQCRKVIGEDIGAGVIGVFIAGDARVART